jgi:crescentin
MKNTWSMKNLFGAPPTDAPEGPVEQVQEPRMQPAAPPPSEPRQQAAAPTRVLDAVGQQNEAIRIRLNNLLERFDDVVALRTEFTAMLDPVAGLITEYPRLTAKLSEAEAALHLQKEAMSALRSEGKDYQARIERLTGDLVHLGADKKRLETQVAETEALAGEFRAKNKQLDLLVSDIENQLSAEIQRARAVSEENQALRQEAQEADQAATRFERDLAETREKLDLLEQENRALHKTVGEQSQGLVTQGNRLHELEQQLVASRHQVAALEERVAADLNLRQRLESQFEAERSAQQINTSALEMKVEGLTGRLAATEKILANARDQIRERNEVVRGSERSMREAIIERNALQRRLEAALQEIDRKTAQSADDQKSRADLADRTDILVKTVSAKEALLKDAENTIQALNQRVATLEERFEQDRGALETVNRRLVEELQTERSERSLAQGALEAARERVTELQTQFLTFKNSARFGGNGGEAKPPLPA